MMRSGTSPAGSIAAFFWSQSDVTSSHRIVTPAASSSCDTHSMSTIRPVRPCLTTSTSRTSPSVSSSPPPEQPATSSAAAATAAVAATWVALLVLLIVESFQTCGAPPACATGGAAGRRGLTCGTVPSVIQRCQYLCHLSTRERWAREPDAVARPRGARMSTPPSITVHVGGPSSRRTSPELWGLFLEDINDALDGGLNADLVRNGDFEATAADAPGWHALTGWDAEPARAVSVRSDAPLSSTNATFARMTAEGSPVSLRNGGYDPAGMLLRAGRYRLRLAARTVDRGSLDARLVATGGDGVLASAPLALSAP